jgi:diguanylate cyclase (GGDEF)-like protein
MNSHQSDRATASSNFVLTVRTNEFADGTAELGFLTHHLEGTRVQLRITLVLCSFFYLIFSLTDVAALGYGPMAFTLFLARLSVTATAAVCLWMVYRYKQSVAATHLAATAVEVVGMGTFMLVATCRPGELPWHAMSMAIMLIVVYLYIPNRLLYAQTIALSSTGVFIFLAWVEGSLKPTEMFTMSMLLLLANTFGSVAARRQNRLWRDEYTAQVSLKNLAVRDPLTGCYNRRFLHEKLLHREISRAQRYGLSLSVIMCDLDHFKSVNDQYGHQAGDAVLQHFSGLLKTMTREGVDSLVRYGGEEFLLILPETDLAGAELLAERLRTTFATSATWVDGVSIASTASFGIASVDFASTTSGITLYELIKSADQLLYGSKSGGRNRLNSLQVV